MKFYSINGKTQTIQQWADEFDISYGVLYSRLATGASIEKCISPNWKRKIKTYSMNGKTQTIQQWAEEFDIHRNVLYARLKSGIPIEKCAPENWIRKAKKYTIDGQSHTLRQWAKISGISTRLLHDRMKNRATLKECLPENWKPIYNRTTPWTDEILQELRTMCENNATLEEMSNRFNVTRERIRQILERISLKAQTPPDCIPLHRLNKQLGTNIKPLLLPEEIRHRGHSQIIFVLISLIPTIRKRLIKSTTRTCSTCKKKFIGPKHKKYCSNRCKPVHDHSKGNFRDVSECERICLWHKKLIERLRDLNGYCSKWMAITKAAKIGELSAMQIKWLAYRNIIKIKPHPTKKHYRTPINLYSYEEIKLAGSVYKEYKQTGQHQKLVKP